MTAEKLLNGTDHKFRLRCLAGGFMHNDPAGF